MAGTRHGHKIRQRLTGGYNKMSLKESKKTDKHYHITDPSLIGFEELAELFLCNVETVKYFHKTEYLVVKQMFGTKKAFDKESAMNILKYFTDENGRLTTKMSILKEGKKKLNNLPTKNGI